MTPVSLKNASTPLGGFFIRLPTVPRRPYRHFENAIDRCHVLNGRALHVAHHALRLQLESEGLTVLKRLHRRPLLLELREHLGVLSKVCLETDEDDWRLGNIRSDLGDPDSPNVHVGRRRDDAVASEKHVRLWIAQHA